MACPHITTLRTPKGVQRVSLASESVFSASARPCRGGTPPPALPRCVEPGCARPASGDVHVCVQCVYSACNIPCTTTSPVVSIVPATAPTATAANAIDATRPSSAPLPIPIGKKPLTHLRMHDNAVQHPISLSVDHGHLYCCRCDDFVYDPYLDAAVELQRRIAASHRRNFLTSPSPLDPRPGSGAAAGRQSKNCGGDAATASPQDQHALVRARAKRRRVVSVAHWVPTEAELALIDAHSVSKPRPTATPTPPVGLYNLGNSCYMNSVLQAFLNAPPLRCFFLADGHRPHCARIARKQDCLACALDSLVCDSQAGEEAVAQRLRGGVLGGGRELFSPSSSPPSGSPFLVPHRMLEIIWKHAEHLASYAQHDAHEFLIATLNILNAHCRQKAPPVENSGTGAEGKPVGNGTGGTGPESWAMAPRRPGDLMTTAPRASSPVGTFRAGEGTAFDSGKTQSKSASSQRSIVHNLFSGTLQSDVICCVCGNRSPTLEKFYDISLDVDNVVKPKMQGNRRSRASTPDVSGGPASGMATPAGGSSRAPSVDGDGSGMDSIGVGSENGFAGGPGSRASRGSRGSATFSDTNGKSSGIAGLLPVTGTGGEQLGQMETANTLMECLARFTEPEILGEAAKMFCAQCGVRQEAQKQMSIRTLPPVLCFHFKRFEQNFAKIRKNEMVKIDTPVEFPVDNLDLSAFQTSSVVRRRMTAAAGTVDEDGDTKRDVPGGEIISSCDDDAIYDLFAVILHVGSIDRGHYTTLVRRRGAWFKCDDEEVTSVSRIGKDIRSGAAYLAFYTQRKPNLMY